MGDKDLEQIEEYFAALRETLRVINDLKKGGE
jgi:hypothetical protein